MRHRCFQLFEFLRRTVHFYTDEVGNLKHLRQWDSDVVQMSEKTLGVFVPFTTENFVAANSEAVEKVLLLACGFLDELRKDGFDCFNFRPGAP